MTIKQKFAISLVMCIITLLSIGCIFLFGYHYVTGKATLANKFDNESMYLQMMLRGLNEVIINEGTPFSIQTEKKGFDGFDEIHRQLLSEVKNPEMRRILIEEIDPEWRGIQSDIKPFLQYYADLNRDEFMIQAGSLITKIERIIEHVRELADEARAVVNETSRKAVIVEKIMVIALIVIILFCCLLATHIYRTISRPIEELTNVAGGFHRGNLNIMLDETRRDEFGLLARYFNSSTKKLREEMAERKQAEERISHIAYHDSLTGLPNRYLLIDRLNIYIAHAKRHHKKVVVLYFDIDDFKRINDTLGHEAGDLLLKGVADTINGTIRSSDTASRLLGTDAVNSIFSRLGGDEFTLLLTDIRDSQDAVIICQRLMEALSSPFKLNGNEVFITISIGIAICPDDGENADQVIKNADVAMYHAKNKGKNNFQFYEDSMNSVYQKRLTMENELRKAIDGNELLLYYQPRIDIRTGNISSIEALVRWKNPDRGLISPAEFIPVAEDTGLIIPLGIWVLNAACAQNKAWQQSGHIPIQVSVNISGKQFQQKDFISTILTALNVSSLDAEYLELEITETILMQNTENMIEMLHELKKIGTRISMDDFGTGYSSFSYLKRFPLDVLKIDKLFIDDIPEKSDSAAIVKAIISMARSLNLKVVAEGVETKQQMDFLRHNKCDEIQGYYFSKPLPAEEFTALLEKSMHQPLEIA